MRMHVLQVQGSSGTVHRSDRSQPVDMPGAGDNNVVLFYYVYWYTWCVLVPTEANNKNFLVCTPKIYCALNHPGAPWSYPKNLDMITLPIPELRVKKQTHMQRELLCRRHTVH